MFAWIFQNLDFAGFPSIPGDQEWLEYVSKIKLLNFWDFRTSKTFLYFSAQGFKELFS